MVWALQVSPDPVLTIVALASLLPTGREKPASRRISVKVTNSHHSPLTRKVVVGMRSLSDNLYDGHTLAQVIEQITHLTSQNPSTSQNPIPHHFVIGETNRSGWINSQYSLLTILNSWLLRFTLPERLNKYRIRVVNGR
ncbi:MAG: hypothetical protein UZ02_AOB001002302 [Nitrosomonas europaea]|nr:MAG: hypothetical protein UZ02_AOB001002302 [Nitrosomonas europaea]